MRSVWLSMAIALAARFARPLLEASAPRPQPAASADVATIAARVKTLRDLRLGSRLAP